MTDVSVRYFESSGPANTQETIHLALKRALELGIGVMVVATCSGETALALCGAAVKHGYSGRLVAVTHHVGFSGPNEDDMDSAMRDRLRGEGFTLVTGTHALSGPERSFKNVFKGIYPLEMVAAALRLFSQGVKTCVECAVMAADAGAVKVGQEAVFIAGTAEGADTACVIVPANQNDFLKLRVREILCKPR